MDKAKVATEIGEVLDAVCKANREAKECLERIVKEAGGFINTMPRDGKPVIECVLEAEGLDDELQEVYGIRYVEGEGLFLFNEDSESNYEYDNDCDFTEEALEDVGYYVSLEDGFFNVNVTVVSILGVLTSYLD